MQRPPKSLLWAPEGPQPLAQETGPETCSPLRFGAPCPFRGTASCDPVACSMHVSNDDSPPTRGRGNATRNSKGRMGGPSCFPRGFRQAFQGLIGGQGPQSKGPPKTASPMGDLSPRWWSPLPLGGPKGPPNWPRYEINGAKQAFDQRSKACFGPVAPLLRKGATGPKQPLGDEVPERAPREAGGQEGTQPRMPTIRQLVKNPRTIREKQSKSPALNKAPQKKGVCIRVYVRNPKKPNSAKRKVSNISSTTRAKVTGHTPGEGHTLQEHSVVPIRGGRAKDSPGVKYHLIGGLYDPKNTKLRKQKRSKYGVPSKKK